jgi:hypothetical protein
MFPIKFHTWELNFEYFFALQLIKITSNLQVTSNVQMWSYVSYRHGQLGWSNVLESALDHDVLDVAVKGFISFLGSSSAMHRFHGHVSLCQASVHTVIILFIFRAFSTVELSYNDIG